MGQMTDLVQIHELARQMARSGRFCSWRLIAIELRFMEGLREAADGFSDPALRDELDTLCREAQKRMKRWPSSPQFATTSVPAIPRPAPTGPTGGGAAPLPQGRALPAQQAQAGLPPARPVPAQPVVATRTVPPVSAPPMTTPAMTTPVAPPAAAPTVAARPQPAYVLEPAPRWVAKYRS